MPNGRGTEGLCMFNSRIDSGVPARAVGVWNYWLRLRATSREWLGESAEVAHCCDGLRALGPDGTPDARNLRHDRASELSNG